MIDQTEVPGALTSLCRGLDGLQPETWGYELVPPSALPQPFRQLLVHQDHMTTTLSRFYGQEVQLNVLRNQRDGSHYRRMIRLSLPPDGIIVEMGVVALDWERIPASARADVLAQQRPLGDILIESDVLREIRPLAYLRFPHPGVLAALWNVPITQDVFGRVGVITVDTHPAIELLEIITGIER